MCIKKLKTASLSDALAEMKVGEIRLAPDGYPARTVIRICSGMREKGYLFQTSTRTGEQTITRLK